jgi:hypothetical protein
VKNKKDAAEEPTFKQTTSRVRPVIADSRNVVDIVIVHSGPKTNDFAGQNRAGGGPNEAKHITSFRESIWQSSRNSVKGPTAWAGQEETDNEYMESEYMESQYIDNEYRDNDSIGNESADNEYADRKYGESIDNEYVNNDLVNNEYGDSEQTISVQLADEESAAETQNAAVLICM